MIDNKKSTDPGLSAVERKTLRGHEAQEAIADHEEALKAFHENREHLREERPRRGADAPFGARTSRRHAHRKRPLCYQDPECAECWAFPRPTVFDQWGKSRPDL
jgi:hypothetical protein